MTFLRSLFLLFAAVGTVASVHAGTLRIALLSEAQVPGDTVFLANFLPPHAPLSARVAAEAISLGAAPQNGSARRFSRDFVSAALQNAGLAPEMFLLPEILTARRAGRTLTRDEAFAAIQSALAKNQAARVPQFHEEDLTLASAVEVPEGAAGLEVTQLSFDPILAQARFRLWPRGSRGTLPFLVTARLPHASSATPASSALPDVVSVLSASAPSGPVLVDPRNLAQLHLHSQNSDMLLAVRPLQPGRFNEIIRVRLAASGKTFRARVIAPNYLDAAF